VKQDFVKALKWLNLAEAFGHPEAAERREMVTEAMTPDQITEAQRLSRGWKPKK
jgi:hypothetical protein